MQDAHNYELYVDGKPLPRNVSVLETRMTYARDAKAVNGKTIASRGGSQGPYEVQLTQPMGADASLSEIFKKSKGVNLRIVHQEPPEEGQEGKREEIVEYVYTGLVAYELTVNHEQRCKTLALWTLAQPTEKYL